MENVAPVSPVPLLAICGWSGTGKTTLIENLVPLLRKEGLSVGVWKHDAHRLSVDTPGKDTDRFFHAGSSVVVGEDSNQLFFRTPKEHETFSLFHLWRCFRLDLVLVEGHKKSPFPKIWLKGDEKTEKRPCDVENCLAEFHRTPDLVHQVFSFVQDWLKNAWKNRPLGVGILIGGESRRMGSPKSLLRFGEKFLLETLTEGLSCGGKNEVVLVGSAPVPEGLRSECVILPDTEPRKGPLGGILSLLRWAPNRGWAVFACDLPEMTTGYLEWLLSQRRPGIHAIVPMLPGRPHVEPLAAFFEPQIAPLVECAWEKGTRSIHEVIQTAHGVHLPVVPDNLVSCLSNLNTPSDRDAFSARFSDAGTDLDHQ